MPAPSRASTSQRSTAICSGRTGSTTASPCSGERQLHYRPALPHRGLVPHPDLLLRRPADRLVVLDHGAGGEEVLHDAVTEIEDLLGVAAGSIDLDLQVAERRHAGREVAEGA